MSEEILAAAERQIDRLEALCAASESETKRVRALNADLLGALKMCLQEFLGLTEKGAGQRLALAAIAEAEATDG